MTAASGKNQGLGFSPRREGRTRSEYVRACVGTCVCACACVCVCVCVCARELKQNYKFLKLEAKTTEIAPISVESRFIIGIYIGNPTISHFPRFSFQSVE